MRNKKMIVWMILQCVIWCMYASPRLKMTINENWRFTKGDIPAAKTRTFYDKGWEIIHLPHTWNTVDTEDESPGYYRGVGWYRKEIQIGRDVEFRKIFLCFEAANQVTEVWINGKKAGEPHKGGYTPFTYDITSLIEPGRNNTFAIRVDNSYQEDVVPLSADFSFFGGIYRDVYLVYTDTVHFPMINGGNGVFLHSLNVSRESALIKIRTDLTTVIGKGFYLRHTIKDQEGNVVTQLIRKMKKPGEDVCDFEMKNPHLWDTEHPYLYTVISELLDEKGNLLDQVKNPLGVRWFSFDAEQGFFLNGRHLKLIGVNRHQDYIRHGNALTDDMHRYDLKLMKKMGINCMRISHYPQDPSVLEMCDKYGFICFEEIPIINRIHQSDRFLQNCKSQITEMIFRDYNHPCIVAWNMSNEITVPPPRREQWSEEAKSRYNHDLLDFLQKLELHIKTLDTTRASMIVHCYEPKDNVKKGYHLADVIGYNKYMGWYERKPEDIYQFFHEYRQADSIHPFFLTEYGAGADARIHTFHPVLYDHSEEYQLVCHKIHLKALLETDFVVGGTVWNFIDFNSDGRGDAIPHINEKGLVTSDRRPKMSYYYYQTVLSSIPMACIPSKLWTVRGGREDSDGAGTCTQPVELFGNTRSVELYLNGKFLGTKTFKNYSTIFNVPFVNGENLLELRSEAPDGRLISDYLRLDFHLQPFRMDSKQTPFTEIAVNCGSYSYVNDHARNNYLWFPDQPYAKGGWGFIGGKPHYRDVERIGTDRNIIGTDLDPVFQTQLRGIHSYRFDVPEGDYELTLLFAETDIRQQAMERSFDVFLNGCKVLESFCPAVQYGVEQAVSIRWDVSVENKGLSVDFVSRKGETILNGIVLRKVY